MLIANLEQANCLSHHQAIDPAIYLDEIGCIEFDLDIEVRQRISQG